MKKIQDKLWAWFFTHIMGVEFIPDSPNFKVTKPVGIAMCEHECMFDTMTKVSDGVYKFKKAVLNG